ncbi:erythroblast NAD(P)(+)--arginine ADP-ribosyltransferase-like [Thamnophis elegans]|uniref:erythroblast NAD(P)(+)--arginine ADP-ribosyltransferase-like n=1 Tax=Thamnophis elegans TaxID=35005 RepID=UPI0013781CA4|nr:erythroblast NAD(P)(+)--arginine ADP-ribosyltransferase-like [Thamnophis elegans]
MVKPIETLGSFLSLMSFHILSLFGQVFCLQKIALDVAKNSLDDLYKGCIPLRELKMKKPGYIPLPKKYIATWKMAISHVEKLGYSVGNFNRMYATAIMAYTIGDHLYRDFNTAAKKTVPGCYEVFRGIKGVCFTVSDKVVRFGQFSSSSLLKKVSQGFVEDTFFSIKTCYGVPISQFSLRPYQKEIVIPSYEMFNVISHKKTLKGVFIRLESKGVFNHFICEVLKGH